MALKAAQKQTVATGKAQGARVVAPRVIKGSRMARVVVQARASRAMQAPLVARRGATHVSRSRTNLVIEQSYTASAGSVSFLIVELCKI